MNKFIKTKGAWSYWSIAFQVAKQIQKNCFIMYYLTKFDDIIQSGFWVFSKITSPNLCKLIHNINYSTSIFPSESGKCGEEGEKLQKFEYLKSEKSFFDEIKKKFIVF